MEVLKQEDIVNVPDYFIYELSKVMSKEELAKKYEGTTVQDINRIVERYMNKQLELSAVIEESKKRTETQGKNPIGRNGMEIV